MGRAKKVRKFAAAKRVIGKRDARLRENQIKQISEIKKPSKSEEIVREMSVTLRIPKRNFILIILPNNSLLARNTNREYLVKANTTIFPSN